MNQLIKESNLLQKEAVEIIKETKIEEVLKNLGKLEYVGSYKLKLLYRRDIDLFVHSKSLNINSFISTIKKIIDTNSFQTIGFADWNSYNLDNGYKGYYIELIYFLKGNPWKFDIWYVHSNDEMFNKVYNKTKIIEEKLRINVKARQQILKLKKDNFNGNKYKNNLSGFDIYQQVLGEINL